MKRAAYGMPSQGAADKKKSGKGGMMGSLSLWHWVVILVVVVMLFGSKRVRTMASGLGGTLSSFRDGVRKGRASPTVASENTDQAPPR